MVLLPARPSPVPVHRNMHYWAKRGISPLRVKDEVEVIGMPGEDECEREMFVTIRWEKEGLAVPLSQLKPIAATDNQTQQAVEDWHYWVKRSPRSSLWPPCDDQPERL